MIKRLYLRLWTTGSLLALGGLAIAQGETSGITTQDLLQVIMFTMIVMAVVALMLTFTIFALLRARAAEKAAAAQADMAPEAIAEQTAQLARTGNPWSWKWIRNKLTDAVPIEQEADIDMGHEYDGIRELDNNLPPWWKYGFYFTIGWAVLYLCVFHIFGDWSQEQQYKDEMAVAEAEVAEYLKTAAEQVDETNVVLLTDAADLASGKKIYEANCLPCHGINGEGGIGPTFADNYWIHGGDIVDVFKTVKYGVPAKGMISWQDQLRPREMQEVSSYLLGFVGTNPEGMKEPEGELYEPEAPAEEAPATEEEVATAEGEVQALSMN